MPKIQDHIGSALNGPTRVVHSHDELLDALGSPHITEIFIDQDIRDIPPFRLGPGQALRGRGTNAPTLSFADSADGIEFTADNEVSHLRIYAGLQSRAIWTSAESPAFGRLSLQDIKTRGRVSIMLEEQQGPAHLEMSGLYIEAADSTQAGDRPSGFGVSVLQGALTVWNKRSSEKPALTANLTNISVGRRDAPVLGSGIFLCGAGHDDISLHIDRVQTNDVYSNGKIAPGTANFIAGGIFVVYGASVDLMVNRGPVVTFGSNDMALDNWGEVERWISHEKVTTFGPSAIGFVNFGVIGQLSMQAPIETYGTGARGYNVYSGTVRQASFDRIVTHGDGAVGVQLSQPVGTMQVSRGIETHGSRGQSLVKGVLQELAAIALSIKSGGRAESIAIQGGLLTHGSDVPALEQDGEVGRLTIEGGFGNRSKLMHTT